RSQTRAHDPPVELDQAAVRVAGECELGEAGEERRNGEAEHGSQHDDGDHGRLEVANHQCDSPSTIGPSVSAGKTINPAVRMTPPTSGTTTLGPSGRNVRAKPGEVFWPASAPASASAARRGANRPRIRATVPNSAEKFVAP